MRVVVFFFFLLVCIGAGAQNLQLQQPVRFLALGDSYTIGQGVPVNHRWPVQLRDSLALRGITTDTLRIIATTGWRTDNLLAAITNQNLEQQNYNLVSLLIGVNNQFQGRPFSQYTTEFPQLLDSAICYTGGNPGQVFVVSIPDYAYTPFGQQSPNPALISQQLDQYNAFNAQAAAARGVKYFTITPISRQGLTQPGLVASDGLHPSGIQYSRWVSLMLQHLDSTLTSVSAPLANRQAEMQVFPKPAHDRVNIRLPHALTGNVAIRLYSPTGGLVHHQTVQPGQWAGGVYQLSLKPFPRGLYLLQVQHAGQQFTSSIVLQ